MKAKNQLELDQDALKIDFAKLKQERDKWLRIMTL
jgi:chemotaxis protein MotB